MLTQIKEMRVRIVQSAQRPGSIRFPRMSTIGSVLTPQHYHCDELFATAENAVAAGDWENAPACFDEFRAATERHFQVEEEMLFPAFEMRTGSRIGPTQIMRDEHRQIRDLLGRMHADIDRHDADDYLGLAETLLTLMRQHNIKEEQILYRLADQALAAERDAFIARLRDFQKAHS